MRVVLVVLCILYLVNLVQLRPVVRIGALLQQGQTEENFAYQLAKEHVRDNILKTVVFFESEVNSSLSIVQQGCRFIEQEAVLLIGPRNSTGIAFLSQQKQVPMISYAQSDPQLKMYSYFSRVVPSDSSQAQVLEQIFQRFRWSRFAVITSYDQTNSIGEFVQLSINNGWKIVSYHTIFSDKIDITPILKEIKESGARIIVINSQMPDATRVFKAAIDLELVGSSFVWIGLDAIGSASLDEWETPVLMAMEGMLALRLHVPESPQLLTFQMKLREKLLNAGFDGVLRDPYAPLLYDAVTSGALAIADMISSGRIPQYSQPISCSNDLQTFKSGPELLRRIRAQSFEGLTGSITFDKNGNRAKFGYDVVNLQRGVFQQIGSYFMGQPLKWSDHFPPVWPGGLSVVPQDQPGLRVNTTLRVVVKIAAPWVDKNIGDGIYVANNKFYGVGIDILNEVFSRAPELSTNYYRAYSIANNVDGTYSEEQNSWSGIISHVLSGRADIGVGLIGQTGKNLQNVSFVPFLDTDFGILFLRPDPAEPGAWSFLTPFAFDLWITIICVLLAMTLLLAILDWVSPFGSKKFDYNYKRIPDLPNNVFLSTAALVAQGYDPPSSLSARIMLIVWFFVSTVLVSTYTANLASVLTTSNKDSAISGVDDIKVKDDVGGLQELAERLYFNRSFDPRLRKISRRMQLYPTVKKGAKAVRDEDIDYFIASTPELLVEVSKDCDLQLADHSFGSISFGFVLLKNSSWLPIFQREMTKLKEIGLIDELLQPYLIDRCLEKQTELNDDIATITLSDMRGLYFFLLIGLGLAVILLLIEIAIVRFKNSALAIMLITYFFDTKVDYKTQA